MRLLKFAIAFAGGFLIAALAKRYNIPFLMVVPLAFAWGFFVPNLLLGNK